MFRNILDAILLRLLSKEVRRDIIRQANLVHNLRTTRDYLSGPFPEVSDAITHAMVRSSLPIKVSGHTVYNEKEVSCDIDSLREKMCTKYGRTLSGMKYIPDMKFDVEKGFHFEGE